MTIAADRLRGGAGPIVRIALTPRRLALPGVLALSAALNLWGLSRVGYGNQYYAAAVLSMLQNWRNFFFVAFDPSGFVSVDKPPLGFWIQALSAKLFGFTGVDLLLPEALAGVGSVALLYLLVRRAFGPGAGLLAALMLALTPVSVAVSRSNTIDSLLVFTVLLATFAAVRAAESGRLRWLLLAAVTVGLGFEIKMMQAYLVVPALGLLYLLAAPRRRLVRAAHLALASVVLLSVSFAWPLAVDLTPASTRPWVDSTQDNSAVDLALGYNGIQRLLGRGASLSPVGGIAQSTPGPRSGPGSEGENGPPGALRLFDQQLAGQASWLLPLSLLGVALGVPSSWASRRRLSTDRRAQAIILWGTWLVSAGAFFSVAGYFHSYYLVMLGPAVAALAAMGVWGGWQLYRRDSRWGLLLPAGLIATALIQAYMLGMYASALAWLAPLTVVVLGCAALGALGVVAAWIVRGAFPDARRLTWLAPIGASVAMLGLVAAPAAWAAMPAVTGQGGGFLPSAGPSTRGDVGQRFVSGGPESQSSQALVAYLEANQGSDAYLAATNNSNAAAPLILATGKPIMSVGGFLGTDPIVTVNQFSNLVTGGTVRYFLSGGGPGGPGAISSWVQANCSAIPASAYGGSATSDTTTGRGGESGGPAQLYDCAAA